MNLLFSFIIKQLFPLVQAKEFLTQEFSLQDSERKCKLNVSLQGFQNIYEIMQPPLPCVSLTTFLLSVLHHSSDKVTQHSSSQCCSAG